MSCCCYRRLSALALCLALALGGAGYLIFGRSGDASGKEGQGQGKSADTPRPGPDAWPMFGGSGQRNMVNPFAKGLPARWKVEGGPQNIKWSAQVGTRAYGGPVVAGGKVFVGTNNDNPHDPAVKGNKAILMCFNEADGKFLWQIAHDPAAPDVAREAIKDGLCSTPCVDGDRLYYVTPACVVVCASTDGKVVWTFDMMKELKVFPCYVSNCSPLVAGDLVFVVTGNGRDADDKLPSPKAPSFLALHKKTGKVAWSSDAPGANVLEGQWSNPAYGVVHGKPQVIFPGGDGWLYAFEPATGKLIWKFDCNPKDAVWKPGAGKSTRNYLVATPVVYDGRVYVGTGLYPDHPKGSGQGHLWCVGMGKTGDVSPELSADGKARPNPNSALVWHFGGEIKPTPQEGREYHFGRTISTCAVQDGLVYAAEYEGFLHCLDAKTGKKYWEHDFKSAVWGSPYAADGKVYIGDEDSDVYVFAQGKEKKLLGQYEMGESVLSTPVSARGVLFVLTKMKLFAIAGK